MRDADTRDYDLVIVGGGLGGCSLGAYLARRGANILILEREPAYRDRVRGEGIFPWGCVEAKWLGIYDRLLATCGREVPYWARTVVGGPSVKRDLRATTPSGLGCLNFSHHEMQDELARIAVAAGVTLRRGAEVFSITPGNPPCTRYRWNGEDHNATARLVVGADGRASKVRGWAGFEVQRDPDFLIVASTLHAPMGAPQDTVSTFINPKLGRTSLVYPVGEDRCRTYLVYRAADLGKRFSGARDAAQFVSACIETGVPAKYYAKSKQSGPLASFNGATAWVPHPARNGVVLIGDAAGASDPSFGSGLSLTLRDVRLLAEELSATEDWADAADAYAKKHDKSFDALHTILQWWERIGYGVGPEIEELRRRANPLLAADPSRRPDIHGLGPDAPHDELARQRFFGES